MRVGVVRVSLVIAACLLWLVGCETQTKLGDLWKGREGGAASDPATTGSIMGPNANGPLGNAGLLGSDPYDDLSHGKRFIAKAPMAWPNVIFVVPSNSIRATPKAGSAWRRPTTA